MRIRPAALAASANLVTWRSGDLEIQKIEDLGPGNLDIWDPKNGKHKILKIEICPAQNDGKVWISRKKSSWPYLGPSQVIFP